MLQMGVSKIKGTLLGNPTIWRSFWGSPYFREPSSCQHISQCVCVSRLLTLCALCTEELLQLLGIPRARIAIDSLLLVAKSC